MNMFTCMNDTAVIPRNASSAGSRDNGINEETVDKLVHECLKLKKKNKELKAVLLGYESAQKENEINMHSQLANRDIETERMVSQMNAQHFIELSQLRDYRVHEVDELTRQLNIAKKDLSQQNPQIVLMSARIASLESELNTIHEIHRSQLEELHRQFTSEKNTLLSSYNESADNQRNALNQRAALAENEVRRLSDLVSQMCADSSSSTKASLEQRLAAVQEQLSTLNTQHNALLATHNSTLASNQTMRSTYEDLQAALTAKQDEQLYYQEENKRLEKQVALVKEELDQCVATGSSRKASTIDMRLVDVSTGTEGNEGEEVVTGETTRSAAELEVTVQQLRQREAEMHSEIALSKVFAEKVTTQLNTANSKIAQLQNNVRELVQTKSAVEAGVRNVLQDNEELTLVVDTLTEQVHQLQEKLSVMMTGKTDGSTKSNGTFSVGV